MPEARHVRRLATVIAALVGCATGAIGTSATGASAAFLSATAWPSATPLAVVLAGPLEVVRSGRARTAALASGIVDLSWSPDGRWLSFERSQPDGRVSVWVVDAAGARLRQVVAATQGPVIWSARGDDLFAASASPFAASSTLRELRPTGGARTVGRFGGDIESLASGETGLAVSTARFDRATGFRSASLVIVAATGGRMRTVARSSTESFDAVSFSPRGEALLYFTNPSDSASLAADGVAFHLYTIATGGGRSIGVGLTDPSWQAWSADGTRVAATLGGSHAAWSTDKHLAICTLAAARCARVRAPARAISSAPSFGAGGRLAYVKATGFGGPGGFTGGRPLSASAVDRRSATFRIWVGGGGRTCVELTNLGAASAPEWVDGGPALLVVRARALWYLASPSAPARRLTSGFFAAGFGYYGTSNSWSGQYALAP